MKSLAVSNTAEALARHKNFPETNDVFTPALLHDMGKLVLGQFISEERQQIENITAKGVALTVAEHMVLGTDHAEIGAVILARWSFPADIVRAVRWHHNPERNVKPTSKSDITYLSNLLCQPQSESDSTGGQPVMLSSAVLDRLGLKVEHYEAFAAKTKSWMAKLSDTLSFD